MKIKWSDCINDSAPSIAKLLFKEWIEWPKHDVYEYVQEFCKKYDVTITLETADVLTNGGYIEIMVAVFHMTDEEIFLHELAHTAE